MDLRTIEELIELSQRENPRKEEATRFLDQLRSSDDKWRMGIQLFFESRNDVARFFGLSLTREFVAAVGISAQYSQIRCQIREALMQWLLGLLQSREKVPGYLYNNVLSIFTLLIKSDYPENWPNAFSDFLQLGSQSTEGLDVVLRILTELEVEVVVFDERRNKEEVKHNTLIKDTMRATQVIPNIVSFLCSSTVSTRSLDNGELSRRCLVCLSTFIGWIDLSLVTQESTMTVLYRSLGDRKLSGPACLCLLELVKKGMDPIPKLAMIDSLSMIRILGNVPFGAINGSFSASQVTSGSKYSIRSNPSSSNALHELQQTSPGDVGGEDSEDGCEEEFGMLIDMLFLEVLGCWMKYEEMSYVGNGNVLSSNNSSPLPNNAQSSSATSAGSIITDSTEQLIEVAPAISVMLRDLWPLVMRVFGHSDTAITSTVVPSLNKLIAFLKQQQRLSQQQLTEVREKLPSYFIARDHVHELLLGVYKNLQFDEDFEFDLTDEEDAEEIEAKKEIRKLFVNCCRVFPEPCLDLITFVLSSLPQPLSSAAFPPLEAALRLVLSFSECGQKHNKLVNEGTFPALIAALHQTDVSSHPHPQVILAYYEVAARYVKQTSSAFIQNCAAIIAGPRGIRHSNAHVRCRSAYFLFKITEAMENRSSTLLQAVGSFADLLVCDLGRPTLLSDSSELHLLEALGLMTSSCADRSENDFALQSRILSEMLTALTNQIETMISHPQLTRFYDEIAERVAHKISGLSSLAKGYNWKVRVEAVQLFQATFPTIGGAVRVLSQSSTVRSKLIMYFHRLLKCVGAPSLNVISHSVGPLLEFADIPGTEELVLLLNQEMGEFQTDSLPLVDEVFGAVIAKLSSNCEVFEVQLRQSDEGNINHNIDLNNNNIEAPHVEAERVNVQKTFLMFVYNVILNGCAPSLTSERNYGSLENILARILAALRGESSCLNQQYKRNISLLGGIPLRKQAITIFTVLSRLWSVPNQQDVSPQLVSSFSSLLCEQVLPTALSLFPANRGSNPLSSLSGGNNAISSIALNSNDAASLSALTEIGPLVYTVIHANPENSMNVLNYFTSSLLPALGWSDLAVQQFVHVVATPNTPMGTVRENFKKFLRAT